jgi:hypothetical protein
MLLAQAWTWLCDCSKCENGFNDASQFVIWITILINSHDKNDSKFNLFTTLGF